MQPIALRRSVPSQTTPRDVFRSLVQIVRKYTAAVESSKLFRRRLLRRGSRGGEGHIGTS